MKTAISIPDHIFEEAEQVVKCLGISRSELYATAVKAYLEELSREEITERLNDVYADEPSELDETLARMESATIAEEKW